MTCTLCGLASGAAAFCCAGCENVYAILLESGVLIYAVGILNEIDDEQTHRAQVELDALTQAIESYVGRLRNPVSDALALTA